MTIFVNVRIVNIRILQKHLKKNKGNTKLRSEINKLISTIETAKWSKSTQIKKARPDADRVHPEGFYFFNIAIDRTMILIELDEEKQQLCGVVITMNIYQHSRIISQQLKNGFNLNNGYNEEKIKY